MPYFLMTENRNPGGNRELTAMMSERSGLTVAQCNEALNAFTDAVSSLLSEGREITIREFGAFRLSPVKEKIMKSPFSGKQITVPAHQRISFRASDRLRMKVNGQ